MTDRTDSAVPPKPPVWRSWLATLSRWVLPRSLFGRAVMIIVTPLLLLQVVTTWVFYEDHWDTVTRRLAIGVAGDIAAIVRLRDELTAGRDAELFAMAYETMQLEIAFQPGDVLPNQPAVLRETLVDRKLADALSAIVKRPFLIDSRSIEKRVEIHIQLADGVLVVTTPRRRLFSSTTYVFILWMVGTSLGLLAVATLFMRSQIRPIRRLAIAAEAFGKGRNVADFPAEGAEEVRQAASAFNLMRDRIRRQIQQRTEMLAGVSHDLRTPLTRMKLELAMLGSGPEATALKADLAEMEAMIEGYLAFARGEAGEEPQRVDLAALLRDLVAKAAREGTIVQLAAEGPMPVSLKPDAFRRCVTNLIANSRRYATNLRLSADYVGPAIEICLDDDGPGIPAAMREEVFKPFFRIDSSRNSETGGSGLGLTIARDVMLGHGGELILEESPLGGLRARLRLPV